MAKEKRFAAPLMARRSRGARPGTENGLDKLLGRVGGEWCVLGGRKRGSLKLNGLLMTVEVGNAPGALGEVLVKFGSLFGGQVALRPLFGP